MKTKSAILFSLITFGAIGNIAFAQEKQAAAPASAPAESRTVAPATTNTPAKTDYPVICYIEKNDREIAIKAGPHGKLYSVKTADGKVLFENLSTEQLRAQAPELQEFIKTAIVLQDNPKKDAPKQDATLRMNKLDATR